MWAGVFYDFAIHSSQDVVCREENASRCRVRQAAAAHFLFEVVAAIPVAGLAALHPDFSHDVRREILSMH